MRNLLNKACRSADRQKDLKDFMLSHSKEQSAQRKLRNELLAKQYRLEDDVESEKID